MQLAATTPSARKPRSRVVRAPRRDLGRIPVVAVVDDEAAVREAMEGLLQSAGFEVQSFDSAEAFLGQDLHEEFACLIVDVGLGGMSGLDLQQHLIADRTDVPIVFITAHDDRDGRMRTQAFASGAVGFFRKPFDDEALLSVVRWTFTEH